MSRSISTWFSALLSVRGEAAIKELPFPLAVGQCLSHDAMVRPGVAPAGPKFLVLCVDFVVNRFRVEGRVEVLQERNDVGVTVTDAAHLEEIVVDINDVK